ncbi:hypothetical protein [Clostridium sp. AM58-1XD]|uniref:hypothetical protein n=1 Tax=Clostridium sp. AM58-1XD TaxID=2292307 RepID=UPI000E47B512|nr:hypothetical protein [Clostridium sp. AM58-1XD]RGY95375.1 hypothetical protein DXA13_19335 [Clostridium sp. AM58-1XD]
MGKIAVPEQPELHIRDVEQLTENDRNSAGLFNQYFGGLLENDAFLDRKAEESRMIPLTNLELEELLK